MIKRFSVLTLAALMLALFMASLFNARPMGPVQAAVITPVAQTARGTEPARVLNYFKAATITADTRACFDLAQFEIADVQYNIDQGTTNTVTLSLQNSNDLTTFNAANAIVTANAADANGIGQYPLFGKYNCVLADVTNSSALSLTVIGVAK